ncbi:MAG: ABC transporter ATP-binding protein [Anaerolineae bacterium]|nr:ABC transporter ATP-binding protein [Anaerolineae bacterium]
MGFFYGLNREEYDREYSDRDLVKRIYQYFKPFTKQVIAVAFVTVTLSMMNVIPRVVISNNLDKLVAAPQRVDILLLMVGVVLLGGVFEWAGSWARRYLLSRIIGPMIQTLRQNAFTASMRHDMSFFDEFPSGSIISRITSDTEEFSRVVQLVTDLIGQVLQLIILFVYMFRISLSLTGMVLAFIPVVVAVGVSLRKISRRVTREGFRVMAEVNTAIQEAVTGISVAKNFRQEQAIYNEFSVVNQLSYSANLRRGYTLALSIPLLSALSGIASALIVYMGGLRTASQTITVGGWYLFVLSMDRFWFPILNISSFWNQFQGGLSAAERVFALIDADPTVRQLDSQPVPQLKGDIKFSNVYFQYTDQEKVLEDFSLHIKPGESIALVGHTGAGKSSIVKLITRFYEFQHGQIRIDGEDIRSVDLETYRKQLGIVSQMPFLFSGTIADNIRYGRMDVTDEEMEEIAKTVGAGEWLFALPEGLETDAGERGGHLSMGQRQMVALMRVLVQRPAIFILDEATASIDPFTEAQIQEATELILKQSTSILIAHRLSTIRAVDRIIVLKNGHIIEQGNHKDLVAIDGHYAELYNTYFRHQSPDYKPEAVMEDVSYIQFLPQRRQTA